ncbi:hypothetical protein H6F86_30145 [Phormidium sp. FACHB-592]|uniref:PEP-CTERM sorting domain-containing protein n=1 Tax=Stenomitos frigidus AS-A4 TaxID=2933935 RepID=A0ABV0KG91_9CYAN|nr:hypothetical protein [Phormidium sp. FACHB-592]MBD2078076.1 hypothetical protein [Phormidium sp. FACHB-592]
MAQTLLKPLWATIAGIFTLGSVTVLKPAQAFSVTYNFTVQITSAAYESHGLMNGATEYGSLTYDNANLTGIGSEYVSAAPGSLTLEFNFLSKLHTQKNDLNYGSDAYLYDYPVAFFSNGRLLGLDFLVVPSPSQASQDELGFRIFRELFYVGATDNFNSGTLAGTVTYGNSAAVPEPSEIGGTILAFSCFSLWFLRRVKG